MAVKFKTNKQRDEWLDPKLDTRLRIIVFAIAGFVAGCWGLHKYREDITITSIFRKGTGSVHNYWRGVDVRSRTFTPYQRNEIVRFINDSLVYDPTRPNLKVCVHHDVGRGIHFHIQVPSVGLMDLIKS